MGKSTRAAQRPAGEPTESPLDYQSRDTRRTRVGLIVWIATFTLASLLWIFGYFKVLVAAHGADSEDGGVIFIAGADRYMLAINVRSQHPGWDGELLPVTSDTVGLALWLFVAGDLGFAEGYDFARFTFARGPTNYPCILLGIPQYLPVLLTAIPLARHIIRRRRAAIAHDDPSD